MRKLKKYSLQNASVHSQLEDLVVVLLHNLFDGGVAHRNVAVLEQELIQDVAVVRVHWQNLVQTCEHLFRAVPSWVDERRQFFSKVDCLVNGNLCSVLLILLEQNSQCSDHTLAHFDPVVVHVEVFVVLSQLGQEVVQRFDGPGSENFIQNFYFLDKLERDVLEASWQLGNVGKHNLQIASDSLVQVRSLQSAHDRLENKRVLVLVELVDDLVTSSPARSTARAMPSGSEILTVSLSAGPS